VKRDFSSDIVWIRTLAKRNGLDLGEEKLDKLLLFAENILLWNAKINLISRKDEENIWRKHILESLAFVFRRSFVSPSSIIDFGTGGGFPGIPLAICLPQCRFLLIDSTQKKIRAVDEILKVLQLPNVTTDAGRGEDLSSTSAYQGKFDYLLARAVASVKEILKWGSAFMKTYPPAATNETTSGSQTIPPGSMVLMKGGMLEQEITEARIKCRPGSIQVLPIVIEGGDGTDLFDKKLLIIRP